MTSAQREELVLAVAAQLLREEEAWRSIYPLPHLSQTERDIFLFRTQQILRGACLIAEGVTAL